MRPPRLLDASFSEHAPAAWCLPGAAGPPPAKASLGPEDSIRSERMLQTMLSPVDAMQPLLLPHTREPALECRWGCAQEIQDATISTLES